MKLYKTSITPTSNFMTTLKGDTLFGQLCWSIVHAFGKEKLESLLASYDEKPFVVVSDAFALGCLPKPQMPSVYLKEDLAQKKKNRKKVWLRQEDLLLGNYDKAITDKTADNEDTRHNEVHNAIDYKSFTTGEAPFSPFSEEVIKYSSKDIYFLLDESKLTLKELEEAFLLMSEYGYGKKSSSGKGRFSFSAFEAVELKKTSNSFMTLSPSKLEGIETKECFYDTFVRFGKHGGNRAYENAFKKPQLLADTAAVVVMDDVKELTYLGQSIRNISTYKDSVHQGYAIVVPLKEVK